jgi:hypothetical protein
MKDLKQGRFYKVYLTSEYIKYIEISRSLLYITSGKTNDYKALCK